MHIQMRSNANDGEKLHLKLSDFVSLSRDMCLCRFSSHMMLVVEIIGLTRATKDDASYQLRISQLEDM